MTTLLRQLLARVALLLPFLCRPAIAQEGSGPLVPAEPAPAESGVEAVVGRWLDKVSGNVAVDAFYLADWNQPADPAAVTAPPHRAFDFTTGFALAFAILDLAYEGETFGATINLRFGQGADRLIGDTDSPFFNVLKQAYVTWKPVEGFALDLGQFDTIYGAEVADSWKNLNYTRGALYFLMQPFYHTGLRASIAATDTLGLTFLVVNGTNNQIDNNQSPHYGAQVSLKPSDAFFTALGYYTGPASSGFDGGDSPRRDVNFEHFIDLVVNASLGPVRLVGNADMYISGPDTAERVTGEESPFIYWGVSLALGVPLSDQFGLALRGEHLTDEELFLAASGGLTTATLTLDYRPIENVIIRLDNRFEYATRDIFIEVRDPTDTWFASTLGVVVTAAP